MRRGIRTTTLMFSKEMAKTSRIPARETSIPVGAIILGLRACREHPSSFPEEHHRFTREIVAVRVNVLMKINTRNTVASSRLRAIILHRTSFCKRLRRVSPDIDLINQR
jgi:hypothetical protein